MLYECELNKQRFHQFSIPASGCYQKYSHSLPIIIFPPKHFHTLIDHSSLSFLSLNQSICVFQRNQPSLQIHRDSFPSIYQHSPSLSYRIKEFLFTRWIRNAQERPIHHHHHPSHPILLYLESTLHTTFMSSQAGFMVTMTTYKMHNREFEGKFANTAFGGLEQMSSFHDVGTDCLL